MRALLRAEDDSDDDHEQGEASDTRPWVLLTEEEAEVNDQVARELANLDDIYQRGGQLVRVVQEARKDLVSAPRIEPVPLASLRELLTRVVRFAKPSRRGDDLPAHPADWCVRAIAARGTWPDVPLLRAVIEWPCLRPDGTILQEPGYDESTGLLYLPSADFEPIPEYPSAEAIAEARTSLLDLVADFPFQGDEHRAAWLAGLLTPFARYAFDGPSPLFMIDANVRGAGKSLLCHVVSLIATGRLAPITTQVQDEAEERKRITAIARAGDPMMLIDNISRPFGNGVLDAALTTTVWKERILQETNVPEYPLLTIWWGTGNNVQIRPHADTWRRILPIRLESPHQNPETRTDFKHHDLLAHVALLRVRYMRAALLLLRAHAAYGDAEDIKLSPWGSYPGWSRIVRGAVVCAGLPDPYKAHEALTPMADSTAGGLDGLVHGWRELCEWHKVEGCSIREALDWLSEDLEYKQRTQNASLRFERLIEALQDLCPTNGRQLPDARAVGYALRAYRGRVVDNMSLDTVTVRGTRRWKILERRPS